MQKTKILTFPLYFLANSVEKCFHNWGGERLIEFDRNFACRLSIYKIMGKCNALYDFWNKLFFDPPYCHTYQFLHLAVSVDGPVTELKEIATNSLRRHNLAAIL